MPKEQKIPEKSPHMHTFTYDPATTHNGRQKAVFLCPNQCQTDAFFALSYANGAQKVPHSAVEVTHFSAEDIRRRGSAVWEPHPHCAGLLEGATAVRVNLRDTEAVLLTLRASKE